MRSKITWTITAVGYYGLIVSAHYRLMEILKMLDASGVSEAPLFKWLYALAYLGFGIILLGAVARLHAGAGAVIWRPTMLVVGALFAALDIWLLQQWSGIPMRLEDWMAALLGLAVAAILARLLPEHLLRLWLGIERRGRQSEKRAARNEE